MNDLMEKARNGRKDALSGRQSKPDDARSVLAPNVEFKSSRNNNAIAFISTRSTVPTSAWLH